MRNIAEYPITKEEILECLLSISEDINKYKRVGDMRPIFLRLAAEAVKQSPPLEEIMAKISQKDEWLEFMAAN